MFGAKKTANLPPNETSSSLSSRLTFSLSHTHLYSSICQHLISTVHISGFVFAIVQQKLVWDSLGSHLSPMQCRVFSPLSFDSK